MLNGRKHGSGRCGRELLKRMLSGGMCGMAHGACSVVGSAGQSCASAGRGSKRPHLAGFGVHVPAAEEFFHNTHVLLCFHRGKGCQHDRCVARLVLVVHVAHVCKDTRLLREKSSDSIPSPQDLKERGLEEARETASGAQSPRVLGKETQETFSCQTKKKGLSCTV